MTGNVQYKASKKIDATGLPSSDQAGPHKRLKEILARHRDTASSRPVPEHSVLAYEKAMTWLNVHLSDYDGLILDACCGRGDSSLYAAHKHPECLVIGIDKSIARLDRQQADMPRNLLLLRADLRDFYRLAASSALKLTRHQIFYPNPYPKASQLQKRWHASSVFPQMLALGGEVELRTNFKIYAEEWCIAMQFYKRQGVVEGLEIASDEEPTSLFEKKYQERAHPLYRVCSPDIG